MDFEYDEQKSESNKIKHGIDFEEAKAIWNDEHSCEFITRSDDENRFLVIGRIEGVLWTAVVTYRDERTRIISVRRSRLREIEEYDNRKGI